MAQAFKRAAENIKNSAFVIPITLVFLSMLVISVGLFIEDYSTSYMGYMEVPTRKVNLWIIPMVALVPQLAQIGFGYVFVSDTNKRFAIFVTIICWVIDSYTDIVYKANGSFSIGVIAFFETITIYTLFSEIMFLTSFGMLIQLFPSFWHQIGTIVPETAKHIGDFLEKMFGAAVGSNENNYPHEKNKRNNFRDNSFVDKKRPVGRPKKYANSPAERPEYGGLENLDETIRNWVTSD